MSFYQGLLISGDNTHVWIGGSDQDVEGKWKWHTLKSKFDIGYFNWAPHEPDNAPNENCLVIDRKDATNEWYNKWNDKKCHFKLYFICSSNALSITTTTTAMTPVTCQTDWTYFQGKCYKLFTELKSFSEAMGACQSYGADLTQVESQAVSDFLPGRI